MKKIAVTICGRKRFLEVQLPYMLAMAQYFDEHQLWVNTRNSKDLEYIHSIQRKYPRYFRLIYQTKNYDYDQHGYHKPEVVGLQINQFYQGVESDAVYVRFDDDICYVEIEKIPSFLEFRINHPEYLIIYPIIVNNSMIHRIFDNSHPFRNGEYDEERDWRPYGGQIGKHVHEVFLNHISEIAVLKKKKPVVGEYANVNCISWLGSKFNRLHVGQTESGEIPEEPWMVEWAQNNQYVNCIYPDMLVCHYAFANQINPLHEFYGPGLDLDQTDILEKYRKISWNLLRTT